MLVMNESVSYLDEGLELVPFFDFVLAHGLDDFSGVAVNAGDDGMAVGSLCCPVVKVLDDDGLPPRIPPVQHQHNLPLLHYLTHLWKGKKRELIST